MLHFLTFLKEAKAKRARGDHGRWHEHRGDGFSANLVEAPNEIGVSALCDITNVFFPRHNDAGDTRTEAEISVREHTIKGDFAWCGIFKGHMVLLLSSPFTMWTDMKTARRLKSLSTQVASSCTDVN